MAITPILSSAQSTGASIKNYIWHVWDVSSMQLNNKMRSTMRDKKR